MTWGATLKGSIDFSYLDNALTKTQMNAIGHAAASLIVEETEEHFTDENGRPFKPYNKDYAAFRAEKLGSGKGRNVDLSFTREMLKHVGVLEDFTTARKVTIGFVIDAAPARGGLRPSQKMRRTNKKRPWFGFGRKGSKRRRRIEQMGSEIFIEALTRQ
ncbi:MAG: hypothetical protein Unbinned4350contig1002_8 [Prokaryotic dsDNA virus sp.]|nr:MAG: hypothetical protein Unbinned4350contig1002_8 [Prokaryotic dsDNA virus sp.]|tara:strand:- start:15163 stop:15639 length:477 start_codon:yes stop_codon:yes gene_type:complete